MVYTGAAAVGEGYVKQSSIVVLGMLLSSVVNASMLEHTHRAQVAGIDVITYASAVKDVVVISGAIPAGDAMADPDNAAVPTLSGMMLDRGTTSRDKFAIAQMLDNVGASISFNVSTQSLSISAKCLKKDLQLVIALIADDLRNPKLLAAEFSKAKQQLIGSLEASSQSTDARAHENFSRAIFPDNHPNHASSSSEVLAAAKRATLADIRAFQAKFYGPAHMTLIVAGDVSSQEAVKDIEHSFAGWAGGQDYVRADKPAEAAASVERLVPLAAKPSVSVILGQPTGLQYRDPDALALRVGTAIFGRGFTGRLMSTVRDKEGLTYDIGAGVMDDSITDGAWSITASFAPALLDKGMVSTRRELERWWKDGVTEKELVERKQGLIGGYQVALSSTAGIAFAIMSALQRGYDLNWLDQYPDAINALTREQVNHAIHNHLDPHKMTVVKAGSM